MKFIKSIYDSETGTSYVILQHLGKKFIGEAHVHPEDKDNMSEFAGCEYAEIRATIKALKYERKIAKNKADQALDFIKSCKCYSNYDNNSETAKVIARQAYKRVQRVNDLTDEINKLMRELSKKINRRARMVKVFERKKNMSKEDK
jgi:hypothetical protein